MKHSKLGIVACAVLFAIGCGESHVEDVDAAIILPDSGPIDAGFDAGPTPPGSVGSACTSDADCSGDTDLCLSDPGGFLPDGYCSISCLDGTACPDGSTCLQLDRTQAYCFDDCNPDAEVRECRERYGCSRAGPSFPAQVCIGGCVDDSDCATGLRCDPASDAAGACYSPDANLGDECVGNESCPMGGFCYAESFGGWPGGACTAFGCDLAANDCPGDAECLPSPFGGGGGGLCVDGCVTDADCRVADGYACRPSSADQTRMACQAACTSDAQCSGGSVCNPALGTCDAPFTPSQLGQMCNRRTGGCTGGSCLTESGNGFPGAYCAYVGCTVGDDTTCPTGGACSPSVGGLGICLRACTASTDCRTGYRCGPVDPSSETSTNACVPGCTAHSDCANEGFQCNPGTGLCTVPFELPRLGEPCAVASDCPGGRCLTEADGWPAGTCAYAGCRLSGTGPMQMCPAGSVCVDDERSDPELGHCIDACTVGTSGCRPDYECVALSPESGTDGACRPVATKPVP